MPEVNVINPPGQDIPSSVPLQAEPIQVWFNGVKPVTPDATWKVREATIPSPIGMMFIPTRAMRKTPADGILEVRSFPAARAAGPISAFIKVNSAGSKVMSVAKAQGSAPFSASVTGIVTEAPGDALAFPTVRSGGLGLAVAVTVPSRMHCTPSAVTTNVQA